MSADDLAEDRIAELLAIEKRVVRPIQREPRRKFGHDEYAYELTSEKPRHRFRIYTRQNRRIAENFSCGLIWRSPSGEDVHLVRYNGPSHRHRNALEGDRLEAMPHIHRITRRYIEAGLDPDGYAGVTDRYLTLCEALDALARDVNVKGLEIQAKLL